jgi:hypothetical protein
LQPLAGSLELPADAHPPGRHPGDEIRAEQLRSVHPHGHLLVADAQVQLQPAFGIGLSGADASADEHVFSDELRQVGTPLGQDCGQDPRTAAFELER